MKTLVLVVCSTLLWGLCLATSSPIYFEGPTSPLFVWSSNEIFSQQNEQVLQTLGEEDIENALLALLTSNTHKSFLDTIQGTPEAVVLFVEPQLETEEVSRFGSAYSSLNGGAFASLKNLVEKSKSSLVAPYVATGFKTVLLDALLVRVADAIKGNVLIVREEGSPSLYFLGRKGGVQTISINDFKGDAIEFTNGVPDLIVVCLGEATTADQFAAHDATIGTMSQMISKATSGNFVGMYTADSSTSSITRTFEAPNHVERWMYYQVDVGNATDNITGNKTLRTYFTGPILEAIMVLLALLTMVFVGICNLCSLQVPEVYEAPKAVQKM